MTAAAMTEDRDRCLAAGMDDFIPKPVSLTAIRDTLTRWARQRPAPAAVAPGGDGAPGHGDLL